MVMYLKMALHLLLSTTQSIEREIEEDKPGG